MATRWQSQATVACGSRLSLGQDENNPKKRPLPPEVTHQALKPVCLLSPELFTAMSQNRSLLYPRGKNNGLLTGQRPELHCIKTKILLSCPLATATR